MSVITESEADDDHHDQSPGLRLDPTRPPVLRDVLLLLQPRTSPLRHRAPHPVSVHYATATEIRAQRAVTPDAAYPDRFRRRRPTPPALPTIAWINDPSREANVQSK